MDRDDCSNRLVSLDVRFAYEILISGDLCLDVLSKRRGSRAGCDLDPECNEPFLNVLRGQYFTELGMEFVNDDLGGSSRREDPIKG